MKFYELADGTIVGTQADAKASKQEWNPIEIPTDKDGLMEFVNNERSPKDVPDRDVPAVADGANCPRCSFDIEASKRAATEFAERAKADAFVDAILAMPGSRVDEIFLALGERVREPCQKS